MSTKTITVTLTRYYFKQTTVDIKVPENMQIDDLTDFLATDEELDNKLEDSLAEATLYPDDDTYEYFDNKEKIGGHL